MSNATPRHHPPPPREPDEDRAESVQCDQRQPSRFGEVRLGKRQATTIINQHDRHSETGDGANYYSRIVLEGHHVRHEQWGVRRYSKTGKQVTSVLAITAIVIVRAGGVWEDARSILLLVPVLFVELALALDSPLLTRPLTGTTWVVAGFLFSVFVAEGLLWGLRIRLSAVFRWPLHALLAILFLYPLVIVPTINSGQMLAASWRIFLSSPAVAVVLLTLLPVAASGAARAGGCRGQWHTVAVAAVPLASKKTSAVASSIW